MIVSKNTLGFFSIRREIRQTLAGDNCVDINIKNFHLVLLSQICEHNNKEHKYLKLYIDNRAELFNKVTTAYNVKKDQSI